MGCYPGLLFLLLVYFSICWSSLGIYCLVVSKQSFLTHFYSCSLFCIMVYHHIKECTSVSVFYNWNLELAMILNGLLDIFNVLPHSGGGRYLSCHPHPVTTTPGQPRKIVVNVFPRDITPWPSQDSNHEPFDPESEALTTRPQRPQACGWYYYSFR